MFLARIEGIHTKNTVKGKNRKGLPCSKIVDGVRMCFSSVRKRRSARTNCRPRKLERRRSRYLPASANMRERPLRAARANRVFCTDKKRIRTKKHGYG
jgi:hypothetical protein